MTDTDYDCGDILIDNGKIAHVAQDIAPPEGCEVIDAKGLWALPGFIDEHCHVGIFEDKMGLYSSPCDYNNFYAQRIFSWVFRYLGTCHLYCRQF